MTAQISTPKQSTRNMVMECTKLVASFFVLFIHVSFPGQFGHLVNCIATMAVPMFFMISGYFNYGASCAAIRRRTLHIAKLLLGGTLLYILWSCVSTELAGGSTIAYLRAALILDPIEITNWIILHIHPYAGHLWYLNAILLCYLCFWGYTRFFPEKEVDYRPFYFLCLILLVLFLLYGVIMPADGSNSTGLSIRNGWVFGLPMFGLGMFLRQYQDRIFSAYHLTSGKLLLIFFGGIAFGLFQWRTTGIGMIPFGMFFAIVAWMLWMISHPTIPVKSKAAKTVILSFGPISTWIYISHLMFGMLYGQLLQEPLTARFGTAEPWLQPVVVLGMSLAASILAEIVFRSLRSIKKKP